MKYAASADEEVRDVKIQPDGKIVTIGNKNQSDYYGLVYGLMMITRFNSDGSLDTTFGQSGYSTGGYGSADGYFSNSLIIQADGKAGLRPDTDSSIYDGYRTMILLRFNSDGTQDPTFGINGQVETIINYWDNLLSAALQPDGKILVTGYTCDFGICDNVLCRYYADIATPNGNILTTSENNLSVYPNPVVESTVIQFSLSQISVIRIDLFDLRGRKIKTIAEGNFEGGSHELILKKENIPEGVYLLQLQSGAGIHTQKLIIQ